MFTLKYLFCCLVFFTHVCTSSYVLQNVSLVPRTHTLASRARLYSCTPQQVGELDRLLQGIARLALRAAVRTVTPGTIDAADELPYRFFQHFGNNDVNTRRTVGLRFQAMGNEARDSPGGRVPILCFDAADRCRDSLYAYVDDTGSFIVIVRLADDVSY